ncbi:hypothetical protein Ae201684P_019541 [Aphanomyces euteiches]|nr:hypothetical protein Ae201684P_019541 [Aphanomyces euteiches]
MKEQATTSRAEAAKRGDLSVKLEMPKRAEGVARMPSRVGEMSGEWNPPRSPARTSGFQSRRQVMGSGWDSWHEKVPDVASQGLKRRKTDGQSPRGVFVTSTLFRGHTSLQNGTYRPTSCEEAVWGKRMAPAPPLSLRKPPSEHQALNTRLSSLEALVNKLETSVEKLQRQVKDQTLRATPQIRDVLVLRREFLETNAR